MGRIAAGLLSGFGQGLQLMGQQQHEAAMENLRNQRQIEQEDRAEARDNRKSERENTEKVGLLGLAQKYKMAEGETEFQYKVRLEKIRAGFESQHIAERGQVESNLATIKADLDRKNDAASQNLKAEIARRERQANGPRLLTVRTDAKDHLVFVYDDGSSEVTNIVAPPDSVRSIREQRKRYDASGNLTSGGETADTPAPGTVQSRGGAQGGNAWYMGNNSGQPSSSDVGNSSPTVITQAQLAQTARDMNMTVVQAKRWAEANGFKIK